MCVCFILMGLDECSLHIKILTDFSCTMYIRIHSQPPYQTCKIWISILIYVTWELCRAALFHYFSITPTYNTLILRSKALLSKMEWTKWNENRKLLNFIWRRQKGMMLVLFFYITIVKLHVGSSRMFFFSYETSLEKLKGFRRQWCCFTLIIYRNGRLLWVILSFLVGLKNHNFDIFPNFTEMVWKAFENTLKSFSSKLHSTSKTLLSLKLLILFNKNILLRSVSK